jgi:hypothetical protein
MLKHPSKAPSTRSPKARSHGTAEMKTTAIVLTEEMWNLLREVAFHRAQASGGRASVSELLRSLVEGHRAELEKEVKRK